MDSKTLSVLEFPKIKERLAAHCDFSASADLARQLEPTTSYDIALAKLQDTSEARKILTLPNISIGGAHDVRPKVDLARRGGVLEPQEILDVKNTLIACRELKKTLEKFKAQYPRLGGLAASLPNPPGLVDTISRILSDRGEVHDNASEKLATLRREMRIAHERLMSRLQKYITEPNSVKKLQEPIITQRDGRYVIPLRAEFKGQIKAITHDQSASGATLFIEPLAVVELNNTLREIQISERNEVLRILAELSTLIGASAQEIIYGVETLAELDLAFAKAKYAEEINASEPLLRDHRQKTLRQAQDIAADRKTPVPRPPSSVRLFQARHPLLDQDKVVPIDLDLAENIRALVITGPNTGGKTVSLKTVGLLVVMAQSGLHIPAQSGSELSIFQDVFADIGDEQSIEQSLSTFSGHITNIIRILKKIDAHSLVILDELGAGTDPQEGAAIGHAILQHLLDLGAMTFVATHYPELKNFAHSAEGVVNASLEFDVKTLRPTYHLTIGLPGRSNALAIASRLGLPESIISAARTVVNPENLRADKLLDDIRKERNRASREREKSEKARSRIDEQNTTLATRLEKIEDERRKILEQARAEAELETAVLTQQIETLREQLKKARQPLDAIKSIEEQVQVIEEKVTKTVDRRRQTGDRSSSIVHRPWSLGDKVFLQTIQAEGVITALGKSDAEVQIGSLRVRAKLDELQRPAEKIETSNEKQVTSKRQATVNRLQPTVNAPGMELDLRGQNSEDALSMLDDYLDRAFLSGMPFVRIIHGKGTGKLRQSVREMLKGHAHVKSFEEGLPSEGGDGVTVAKILNG